MYTEVIDTDMRTGRKDDTSKESKGRYPNSD